MCGGGGETGLQLLVRRTGAKEGSGEGGGPQACMPRPRRQVLTTLRLLRSMIWLIWLIWLALARSRRPMQA